MVSKDALIEARVTPIATMARAGFCASRIGVSPSRFLHLFKEQTGVSFRAFRAWKRARHLLHFVNEDINLAHLAQDIGYPDSTHFSHSIRRFYGLKPRAIFSGSRDLAIYSHRRASTERNTCCNWSSVLTQAKKRAVQGRRIVLRWSSLACSCHRWLRGRQMLCRG